MSNVLNWEDKINTPELEAWLQQFGNKYYLSAEEINELRDVINSLNDQVGSFVPADAVLKTGEIDVDGLNVSVAADEFAWRLSQVEFMTHLAFGTSLNAATDNYIRYDLLVGKNDGTLDIQEGTEGEFTADIPTADAGTIALAVIAVQGAVITTTTPVDLTALEEKVDAIESRVEALENFNPAPQSGFTGEAFAVWSGVGLIYNYNFSPYYLEGVLYPAVSGSITLTEADPTNPRFSSIIADENGANEVLGTPSENPATPPVDPNTELFVINVLINAGATTPAGTSSNLIYNEGTEAETLVSTIPGLNFTSTEDPYRDTYCIDAPAFTKASNRNIQITLPYPFLVTDGTALRLFIKFKGTSAKNESISFQFYKDNFTTQASFPVTITRPSNSNFLSDKYNISFGTIADYQLLVIPFSDFMFKKDSFDQLAIVFNAAYAGFKIDYIDIISANGGVGGQVSAKKGIAGIITDNGTYGAPTPEAVLLLKGVNGAQTRLGLNGEVEIDGQNFINKETYNWIRSTTATGVLTDFSEGGYNMSISFENTVTELQSLIFNTLNKPYFGALGFIKNGQTTDIVIKHKALSLVANRFVFSFPDEQDLVLKPNQILQVKAAPDETGSFGYLEMVGVSGGTLDETNLAHLSEDQEFTGNNSFTEPVSAPTATADEHLVPKVQMDAALDLKVDKDGAKVLSDVNFSAAKDAKLASIDATHYLPPLQTTVQLSALTQAGITDKARVYVEDDLSDYFYDATASSGDIAPDDQTGGVGFWRKVAVGGETAASIKTKYESNPDTNAYTDAEKSIVANQSGVNTGDQDLSGYAKKYGTRTVLSGTAIDWSTDTDVYTKTLTANTTFTDSNLPSGTNTRTIVLSIDGAYSITFPAYYKHKGGTYDTAKTNQIVLQCVNGTSGSERVNYIINPDL